MSSIFALAQDAERRAGRTDCRMSKMHGGPEKENRSTWMRISDEDIELILLVTVVLLLLRSGADTILLLAIMYVII